MIIGGTNNALGDERNDPVETQEMLLEEIVYNPYTNPETYVMIGRTATLDGYYEESAAPCYIYGKELIFITFETETVIEVDGEDWTINKIWYDYKNPHSDFHHYPYVYNKTENTLWNMGN